MERITTQNLAQFETLGYFVTDVTFDDGQVQTVADEMDRVYQEGVAKAEKSGDAEAVEAARGRRSYGQFHTLSPIAAEFVKSDIYLEACRKLIGPNADLYYNQAAVKVPGKMGKIFTWHQDAGYVVTNPLEYITCWTAISDSNLDNGCIWVILGSHKWGLLEHKAEEVGKKIYGGWTAQFEDDSAAIPVEMKAGQVAIFSSLMLHQSGPNKTTDSYRRGYVVQYHVPEVVNTKTGKPWGDLYPVLRDGVIVKDAPLNLGRY